MVLNYCEFTEKFFRRERWLSFPRYSWAYFFFPPLSVSSTAIPRFWCPNAFRRRFQGVHVIYFLRINRQNIWKFDSTHSLLRRWKRTSTKSNFAFSHRYWCWFLFSSLSHSLSLSPFSFAEAGIEDSITISVDDTDFSASKTEMKTMLDKADLERHGYEREEINKLTTDNSGRKFYSKALFYFKAVKCSEATQTIQELKNLLPGNVLSSPMQSVKFNEFFLVIFHCVKARNVDYSFLWFSTHGVTVGLTFLYSLRFLQSINKRRPCWSWALNSLAPLIFQS